MSKVESINSYRQHITISTPDNVHIIPAIWFDRFVSGEMGIDTLDEYEDVMRSIVSCWLTSLRKTH